MGLVGIVELLDAAFGDNAAVVCLFANKYEPLKKVKGGVECTAMT
jgi:hypothetical protein